MSTLSHRLALAALALLGALYAGGAFAQALGNPFYTLLFEPGNAAGDFPANQSVFLNSGNAINGDLGGGIILGPYALPPKQADLSGAVLHYGKTFWADASTPRHTSEPLPPDTLVGGFSTVDVYQSFRKTAPDASVTFTYSSAFLQLYKDVEIYRPCDDCIHAEVNWAAETYLNSGGAPLWSQDQSAALYDDSGTLRLDIFGSGTPTNAPWQWDCVRCGGSSKGIGLAQLQAPYTGHIDLSGIPYDPNLPADQQPEFTVHYTLFAYAIDDGIFSGAHAFARDPLGGDSGVELDIAGLMPTDNPRFLAPVPEPASWAMLAGGLLALLLIGRRRRGSRGFAATAGSVAQTLRRGLLSVPEK